MNISLGGWKVNSPASHDCIAEIERSLRHALPPDYVTFIRQYNGGEGPVGESDYLVLFRCERLIELNDRYEIAKNLPGFFLIGSDGGGEAYCFNLGGGDDAPVVKVPWIPMSIEEAIVVAPTLTDLLSCGEPHSEPG